MSTTLREVFRRQAEATVPPELDLDALVARGETRLRRRRWAVAGATAAAVGGTVLALAVSLAPTVERSTGPSGPPERSASPVRPLVWSEGALGDVVPVHYGDRLIRTGQSFVHLDVTDDGVVWSGEDGVWFSDGGRSERIDRDHCGLFTHFGIDLVQAGTSGSLVTWLDCSEPAVPELVVRDTSLDEELLRRPLPSCGPRRWGDDALACSLHAIVGEHVYLDRTVDRKGASDEDLLMVDVPTGRLDTTTSVALDDDVRSRPRGLVLGRTWRSGTAVAGSWVWFGETGMLVTFRAVDGRLVPLVMRPPHGAERPTSAFDTGTGDRVDLRLPRGYRAGPEADYHLTQWLSDDTLALEGEGDLLRCRISDGHCSLAVPAPRGSWSRNVPSVPLPG